MSEPIKSGDDCLVIGGALRCKSPNIGKRVRVVSMQGEHTTLGRIWLCTGEALMQFDGSVSGWADFPAIWLEKAKPDAQPLRATTRQEEVL